VRTGKQGFSPVAFLAADVKLGVCCPGAQGMNPVAGGYFSEKSLLKGEVYESKTLPSGLIAATLG